MSPDNLFIETLGEPDEAGCGRNGISTNEFYF